MPQYMLLIYMPAEGGPSEDARAAERPRWFEYTESLRDAGIMVSGDALHGVDAATTVRVRYGETQITDGPFAETKELLGGYYVIDVPDLDTALASRARAERGIRVDRGAARAGLQPDRDGRAAGASPRVSDPTSGGRAPALRPPPSTASSATSGRRSWRR